MKINKFENEYAEYLYNVLTVDFGVKVRTDDTSFVLTEKMAREALQAVIDSVPDDEKEVYRVRL